MLDFFEDLLRLLTGKPTIKEQEYFEDHMKYLEQREKERQEEEIRRHAQEERDKMRQEEIEQIVKDFPIGSRFIFLGREVYIICYLTENIYISWFNSNGNLNSAHIYYKNAKQLLIKSSDQ